MKKQNNERKNIEGLIINLLPSSCSCFAGCKYKSDCQDYQFTCPKDGDYEICQIYKFKQKDRDSRFYKKEKC